MDFAKFLNTGELSDVTVTVDGKDFPLHKFPLYIKSDFFRALARRAADTGGPQPPDNDGDSAAEPSAGVTRIVLSDFPGGPDTFQLVAAYCYNVRLDVTKRNVCQLRCAAEFLQMTGSANLAGVADRALVDILTSAKIRRRLDVITQLLRQCQKLGPIADQANIITSCLEAIVDSWLLISKFSTRSRLTTSGRDADVIDRLLRLPLVWFIQLVHTARSRCVGAAYLTTLIERYVTASVDRYNGKKQRSHVDESEDRKLSDRDDDGEGVATNGEFRQRESETDGRQDGNEDDVEETEEEEDDDEERVNDGRTSTEDHSQMIGTGKYFNAADSDEVIDELEEPQDDMTKTELCDVICGLLVDIPVADYAIVADTLSPRWIIDMLTTTELIGCDKSRDILLRLASFVSQRFDADGLAQLEPDTFVSLVRATCGTTPSAEETNDVVQQQQPSRDAMLGSKQVCRAVDLYLKSLTERGELTVDIFRQIVEAIPDECRTNDDTFFDVLRHLLGSDKSSDMNDTDRQSLLDSIDYNRLSENSLQTALDSKLVPAAFVAKAALNLCATLRSDLEAANEVIRRHKNDLDRAINGGTSYARDLGRHNGLGGSLESAERRYPSRRTPSTYYNTAPIASSTYRTGTGSPSYDVRRRHHVTSSSQSGSTYRSVPSLASNLELQLALGALHEDGRYGSYGGDLTDAAGTFPTGSRYGLGGTSGGGIASYYGSDVTSTDPLVSSTYSRSKDPLSMSSSSRSPYTATSSGTTSLRFSSSIRRR